MQNQTEDRPRNANQLGQCHAFGSILQSIPIATGMTKMSEKMINESRLGYLRYLGSVSMPSTSKPRLQRDFAGQFWRLANREEVGVAQHFLAEVRQGTKRRHVFLRFPAPCC